MTTSTKLRATPEMIAQRTKQELEGMLTGVRQQFEGNPQRYGRPTQKFDQAERAIFDKRFQQARDHLIDLQQHMDARDEAAEAEAQAKEQERLADARNTPTVRTETGVSTRDGWLWLVNKGRYSPGRVEAGRLFREKFLKATDDPMKSCLNDSPGGGGGDANPMAGRLHAQFEVEGVKRHMVSSVGQVTGAALFDRLCAVVGRGETARQLANGDGHKAEGVAIELGFALDLAGVYLGAVRV